MYFSACVVEEKGRGNSNEPRPLKQCQFPFIFDGETFNGCIDFILRRNGGRRTVKPWCSTKVDETTREHIKGQGFYGDCDNTPECLHPEEEVTSGKNIPFSLVP